VSRRKRTSLDTADNFGERQASIDKVKLTGAIAGLESGPDAPGSVSRDEILPNLRSLHVARHRRGGRHFIMYRTTTGQVIEVVRILHDAMDLARHIPPETS
jgi:toxin ParE1/3/4